MGKKRHWSPPTKAGQDGAGEEARLKEGRLRRT